jgi:hypothetical protein
MSRSLNAQDYDRLRADLTATAARHDASSPGAGAVLPAAYTLLEPAGPGKPITLLSQPLDRDMWRDIADPQLTLAALSVALRAGGAPGVYGYALAFHGHPAHPDDDPDATPCVILAVGRDGEVFLAGTGDPGPRYRAIAHGLEQMVHAAQQGHHPITEQRGTGRTEMPSGDAAMNDTAFEVVWEVVEITNYRTTWTATEIAEQFGLPANEVTAAVVTEHFEDLLNDEEDDEHLDDGPDVDKRTVISVQPLAACEGKPGR